MTIHAFTLTEAYYPNVYEGYVFPNVYEGYVFPNEDRPTYGLSIKAEELPDHLRPYARRPKDAHGFNIITITAGKVPPTVVTRQDRSGAGQMHSILNFARDANLRLDDLLKKIPLELATEVVEFDTSRTGPSSILILRAIRLDYTDVLRRYDELCAEYWTGA